MPPVGYWQFQAWPESGNLVEADFLECLPCGPPAFHVGDYGLVFILGVCETLRLNPGLAIEVVPVPDFDLCIVFL
jgi:hypothetical protein